MAASARNSGFSDAGRARPALHQNSIQRNIP
jgi:hypothetical protein